MRDHTAWLHEGLRLSQRLSAKAGAGDGIQATTQLMQPPSGRGISWSAKEGFRRNLRRRRSKSGAPEEVATQIASMPTTAKVNAASDDVVEGTMCPSLDG